MERLMKIENRMLIATATIIILLAAGAVALRAADRYTGLVTASQIASTGSPGYWERTLNCHDETECSRRLVEAGGHYVLLTSQGVMELSDQDKAAEYAGMAVIVDGTLGSNNTIDVANIQPYSSPERGAQ